MLTYRHCFLNYDKGMQGNDLILIVKISFKLSKRQILYISYLLHFKSFFLFMYENIHLKICICFKFKMILSYLRNATAQANKTKYNKSF